MNRSRNFHSIFGSVILGVALPLTGHAALISHWSLDDTSSGVATDSVGGNHATWQNGTNTNLTNVSGQIGVAADLADAGGPGANNYFQVMIPQLIGVDGLSISAWINNRTQASSGYNGIFMTRTFNGATGNSWGIAVEGDHLDSRVNGPGIDSADILGATGEWKHVVLAWDGVAETHTQYIDGVETNTGASIAGPIAGPDSGPWYIGYDDCCGNTRDYEGAIDDVSVWGSALSATEVKAIHDNGVAGVGVGAAVPEPSASLLGLFGAFLLLVRRRCS